MTELSLNILDVVQNSVSANASVIEIAITEVQAKNSMTVKICDNGRGMDEKMLKSVEDPFVTSRSTRKVGLGIPFFKMAAELAGGSFEIESKPGSGTVVKASFILNHIDRPPLGDMRETMLLLIKCNPEIDFIYEHRVDDKKFIFDMREVRKELQGISPAEPEVLCFISKYFEGEKEALYI